jgi:hypothetical protein
MWQPRRLTTLWASTSRYKDSFAFIPMIVRSMAFEISADIRKLLLILLPVYKGNKSLLRAGVLEFRPQIW